MRNRPFILLTNDDGIRSPGLSASLASVEGLGDVCVVAPVEQQTGMGRAFPRFESQGKIEKYAFASAAYDVEAYALYGSPAQAVAHAVLEICGRKPSLCISGINDGENLGGMAFASGTIGAAAEAASHGIPAFAVSLATGIRSRFNSPFDPERWTDVIAIVHRIAKRLLNGGMPNGIAFLNVNIPDTVGPNTPIRITSQSRYDLFQCIAPSQRDLNAPLRLPVGPNFQIPDLEPGSDLRAVLVDRVISITPMGHDLTARDRCGNPIDFTLDFAPP